MRHLVLVAVGHVRAALGCQRQHPDYVAGHAAMALVRGGSSARRGAIAWAQELLAELGPERRPYPHAVARPVGGAHHHDGVVWIGAEYSFGSQDGTVPYLLLGSS